MKPYALNAGEGRTYCYGIDFTVKAGELRPGRGATFVEYTTRKGEEPPDHTHPTEDEMFYVLEGEVTFRCGSEAFEVGEGGFVYLPQQIEHGYTIKSEGQVRLTAISFTTREASGEGWGGFVTDIERDGELISPLKDSPTGS